MPKCMGRSPKVRKIIDSTSTLQQFKILGDGRFLFPSRNGSYTNIGNIIRSLGIRSVIGPTLVASVYSQ